MGYDCLVIGAGLSGLASSIILSKNGYRTALVEKSSKTGSLVRGFKRSGKYFDTGFHHAGGIGEGSSGRMMLDYLNVSGRINMKLCSPDCFDSVKFRESSFEFRFPVGFENIREALCDAFPEEAHAVDAYLKEIKQQCSSLPFLNLEADLNVMNILENVHGKSLSDFLSGLTDNKYLKSVLGVHGLLNGVPASEQGLNNYSYIVGPYYESVSYIEGGGSALIDAFEKSAKVSGVDIFTGMEVSELLLSSSGELTGAAFKDGTAIECRNCISTVHPINLIDIVPENCFRKSYIRRIKSLDETGSAFILYGTFDADMANPFGPSLYLFPDPKSDFGDCSVPIEQRPANLISNNWASKEDISRNGFIMIVPALMSEVDEWKDSARGNRPSEYRDFKNKIKDRMLKLIESFYPGTDLKLEALDCSTPLTLMDYSGNPYGSMYGAKHRIEQYNPFPVTKLPGLYLAGQSVVAPGLLGTVVSAFLACGYITGHDFLRGELKKWL